MAVARRGELVDTGDEGEGEERGVAEKDEPKEDEEKDGMDQRDVGGVLGEPLPLELPLVDGGGKAGASSPSMGSSSIDGKKFLNNASACHFDAFLNSIHTSMRPGLERAGSRRSRWLVVL